jgi:hypothetical protein
MKILSTMAIGRSTLDFGLATTQEEREAVLAQRFRVYQRQGYYREGIVADQDEWDGEAIFFLASLRRSDPLNRIMVGSARLIRGRADPTFIFPCQRGHRFDLPGPVLAAPASQREEVGRVVSEMPRGWGVSQLVTTLGLLRAMGEYHDNTGRTAPLRCGLATIKLRLLRGLRSAGLPLDEIPSRGIIYPLDGPVAGYFHRDPVPTVPVYWLIAEMIPDVRRVVGRYQRLRTTIHPTSVRSRKRGEGRWPGTHRLGRSHASRDGGRTSEAD